jgi:hypothetical protein
VDSIRPDQSLDGDWLLERAKMLVIAGSAAPSWVTMTAETVASKPLVVLAEVSVMTPDDGVPRPRHPGQEGQR